MSPQDPKKDKVERVVDSILSYIIEQKLKVGDKLPPEEELVRLFGVSRLCVREALRGLKFLGLIETGTRRGTTMKDVDFTLLSRVLCFQIAVSDVSTAELLNARIAIEMGAINLLIDKVSEKELDELEALADCTGITGDLQAMQERDCAFHLKLTSLADNTILLSFSRILELFFSRPLPSSEAISQRANDEHHLLIRAIREKNKYFASGLLYSHLTRYIRENQNNTHQRTSGDLP